MTCEQSCLFRSVPVVHAHSLVYNMFCIKRHCARARAHTLGLARRVVLLTALLRFIYKKRADERDEVHVSRLCRVYVCDV